MKQFKLFALALMAMFSMSALAQYSHVGATAGTYTIGDLSKPGSDTRFVKITDGMYLHRNGTFSASSYGLKTQNNTSGIVLYTTAAMDVTASFNYQATKNAEDVTVYIKTITAAEYDAFFTGTNNSTKTTVAPTDAYSFTVTIENAKASYSNTYSNLAAGYYYIIATGAASNTYFESIQLTAVGGSTPDPECTEADATFTAASAAIVIAANAEEATTQLTFTKGNNTSNVEYTVLKGGKATEDADVNATGLFTATEAGEYIVKATQEADGTYCEVTKELTITVTDNRPKPQVLVLWDKEETNQIGSFTTEGSVAASTVKINSNQTTINSLNFSSSFNNGVNYLEIKPDEGGFEEGDQVYITICFNNSDNSKLAKLALYDADNSLLFTTEQGVNGRTEAETPEADIFTLNSNTSVLRLGRDGNTATHMIALKVLRPADDGTPKLAVNKKDVELAVTAEYPTVTETVTFTGRNLTPGTYNLVLNEVNAVTGMSVNPTSVTVDADGKLNQEVTITYTSTVDVAPATASLGLVIGSSAARLTINYSASLAKNYLQSSVNFEQLVLDNSTKYDIKAVLDAANIEYANLNDLDSLNDEKSSRNEPYLGIKIKTSGGYMKALVKKGDVLRVKFGFIDKPLKLTLNGVDSELSVEAAKAGCELTAAEDTYVTITTTSGNTVVIKQIMLNEAIKEVTLPEQVRYKVTFAETTGGKVVATEEGGEAGKAQFANKGTIVTLTITPDENYEIESVKVNGNAIDAVEGVYSFTMPAANVEVAVTFKSTGTETGLENIELLNTDAPMFNVLGMKVDKEYKGIVIQNGKKFLLK